MWSVPSLNMLKVLTRKEGVIRVRLTETAIICHEADEEVQRLWVAYTVPFFC